MIALTPKEFNILELLFRRAGQVVSKSEILGRARDFAYDGDPNMVEVYVTEIRKKIESPFGHQNLLTVWGAVYEIVTDTGKSAA